MFGVFEQAIITRFNSISGLMASLSIFVGVRSLRVVGLLGWCNK